MLGRARIPLLGLVQQRIENQVRDAAGGSTGVADDSPGSGGDIGNGTPADEE